MKTVIHSLIVTFICICKISFLLAQEENLNVLGEDRGTPWKRWIEWSNGKYMLVHHLNEQAFGYLDLRDQEIDNLRSKPDWIKRQKKIKEDALRIIGPFPEKTDLNPIITEVIKKEGYKIEKIIFESLPNFYVPACMFLPDDIKDITPTIIYVCGHSDLGFRSPNYQRVILNLVKKGFIVFAIDAIGQGERNQYLDDKFSVVGSGVVKQHNHLGFQCFLSGVSPVRYFTWDGIRAVDYLLTRPEVDPKRIGITGRSGGGLQTLYISAFDERVYAAAPENNVSSARRMLQSKGPSDAENNLFHGFKNGLTNSELLQVRVPKPDILVATTRDNKAIQGTRETYEEVLKAYKIFGKEENFDLVEDHAYHASTLKNREAVYAFFQKHLKLPGNPNEEDVDILEPEEFNITPSGQVLTYLGGETVFSLNKKATDKLIKKIEISRKDTKEHLNYAKRKAKELSGYVASHEYEQRDLVFRGGYRRDGYSIEMYGMQGEGDYIMPILLFIPDGNREFPAIIYLHPEGKIADASPGGQIEKLVKQGFIVAAPDLIGTGETEDKSWATNAVALQIGRSIVGIHAGDIGRIVNFLKDRNDVQGAKIGAIAFDDMCPALIHAAAFNQSICMVSLVGSTISYKSLVMNKYYKFNYYSAVPGALIAYDLPDLIGCIAPRKLIISELKNQMREPASLSLIEEELAFPRSMYSLKGVSENMKVLESEPNRNLHLSINWGMK